MPRRSMLSASERESLFVLPDNPGDLIRLYTFSDTDLAVIRQRRGAANRLGFAVHLSYMRYPGVILPVDAAPFDALVNLVSAQLNIDAGRWSDYGQRAETRREHLLELQSVFGFRLFTGSQHQSSVDALADLADQTDKGVVLANALIHRLRAKRILLPSVQVIERVCAEAVTGANRRMHASLTAPLTPAHRRGLDALLKRREDSAMTLLAWLRQSPAKPNSRHMLEHIERLRVWQALELPTGIEREVHRNRLLKMAREGAAMTPADLAKFESQRRYATLVAQAIEGQATVTDEIIDLHDRIIGKFFNTAKHKHENQFQASGKSINDKVRLYGQIGQVLLEARNDGTDPFEAIESVIPWDSFAASVDEARKLAQTEDFDFLRHISDSYTTVRRYAPEFLNVLDMRAAPGATDVLDGIDTLRAMNETKSPVVAPEAPTGFVKKRWQKLVINDTGIDRRYYELCALSELKNSLRSGDVWVQGSRQFKDFQDYLVPTEKYESLKRTDQLPLDAVVDANDYLRERLSLLEERLATVNDLSLASDLPDAVITDSGLKITPLDASVPEGAQALINRAALALPHVKITDLLLEVDSWTDFSSHFTHLKSGEQAKNKTMLFTAILADAINLGLVKMAESCPGTTYSKLSWLQAWHIRDETYSSALAELVNTQLGNPFAAHFGDGTTSSSDGQRFRTGSKAMGTGHINPKYGSEPGRLIYTHISDQYSPFHTKVINVGVRDSTYVLDGLLYHESDLRIAEHYTDTAGFTDHVFALTSLLGFRFAPRIRDLGDTKLYIPSKTNYEGLKPMIGGTLNIKHIQAHWDDILRLATSIKQGTVTASLMLKKLGAYPRQNGLALALRELGRIERTLFILDWLQDTELRRRVNAGLNKGEARNALARAVFFNRLGEIRDRNFDQQRYRASGLNLVTAAIVLWNTVYLDRATSAMQEQDPSLDPELFQYLSPLGWDHINLTGDYTWRNNRIRPGKFRQLRPLQPA